ncbi:hypothetical protein [Asticcacaulis sp. W401b]|uniref:hypothetical protein n=1 Tax=Asticcacaulis sp. W401b TaxID=3388666 RepID=UPI003970A6DC
MKTFAFWLISSTSALAFGIANAQVSLGQIPVIELAPDYQGVDANSGGYTSKFPFSLGSPASSRLQLTPSFNSRKLTNNLIAHLSDETFVYFGQDHTTRDITVVYNGKARFYSCVGVGACTQTNFNDGVILTRLTMRNSTASPYGDDSYQLRDKDGTIVSFFTPAYSPLPPCYDASSDCNAAWYNAYAFASEVKFPNGEKLTYEPTAFQEWDETNRLSVKVRSNLGYAIKFAYAWPAGSPYSTVPGSLWLRNYVGDDPDLKLTYLGPNGALGSIKTVRTKQNSQMVSAQTTDHIGRSFGLNFETKSVTLCSPGGFPASHTMVNKVTTPANRIINITYNPVMNAMSAMWEVTSVSKGGRTWNYTRQDPNRAGLTVTDPLGGKKTTGSLSEAIVMPGPGTGCFQPNVPTYTLYVIDEINRQTAVGYNMVSMSPSSLTLPENNGYRYVHDGRNNITGVYRKTKSASENLHMELGYDAICSHPLTCNNPNWIRDAKGLQTDYTYYSEHGGVKTVTAPANQNGLYLRIYSFYEAFDTGDGIIYRKIRTEVCGLNSAQLTLSACPSQPSTQVTLTTYWQKTFLPQVVTITDGAGSDSATTIYGYDDRGLVTSTNGPRTDVDDISYTTYDSVGRPIFDISADPDGSCQSNGQGCLKRQVVKHYYNDDNQETRTETGVGNSIDGSDFTWLTAKNMYFDSEGQLTKTEVVVP